MTENKHLSHPNREVFVLRLWHRHGNHSWIAEIQHVRSGQITHMRNAAELMAYIEGYMQPIKLEIAEDE